MDIIKRLLILLHQQQTYPLLLVLEGEFNSSQPRSTTIGVDVIMITCIILVDDGCDLLR